MFVCCKMVITSLHVLLQIGLHHELHHHIYCLLLLGLLEMLSSYRLNSTVHPPCHHVTYHPHKVAYLILWLFSFIQEVTLKWPKIIALLCVAVVKKHLGRGAQIAGSAIHVRIWKLVDSQPLQTDGSYFSNLVKAWRLGKNNWVLVCWKEIWQGWQWKLGK